MYSMCRCSTRLYVGLFQYRGNASHCSQDVEIYKFTLNWSGSCIFGQLTFFFILPIVMFVGVSRVCIFILLSHRITSRVVIRWYSVCTACQCVVLVQEGDLGFVWYGVVGVGIFGGQVRKKFLWCGWYMVNVWLGVFRVFVSLIGHNRLIWPYRCQNRIVLNVLPMLFENVW